MRVWLVANNDVGLYKFRKELVADFLQKQYEVHISLPYGEFVKDLEEMGCIYHPTEFERRGMNPLSDLKLFNTYRRLANEIRPDAVLTYTIKPNIYGGLMCRLKKIPYFVNVTGLGTAIEKPGLLSKVLLWMYKMALKNAQCVFCQNEANKALLLEKKIFCGNIRLIPGSGVNLNDHAFEPYPCEQEITRLLFIGRIMKDKGIGEFLDCAEAIAAENPHTAFDIVGDYDEDIYKARIDALAEKGIVAFHGVQRDVRPFIKNCHAVVLPSYHEGLSNVLLEAASTGRPIITTRIPGCRETFREGISGLGCEAQSSASLIQTVNTFLSLLPEERAAMGREARQYMEAEFDRGKIIKAYNEEINKKRGLS